MALKLQPVVALSVDKKVTLETLEETIHDVELFNLTNIMINIYQEYKQTPSFMLNSLRYEFSTYLTKALKICEKETVIIGLYYLSNIIDKEPLTLDNVELHFWMCIILAQKMYEDVFWDNNDYFKLLKIKTVNISEFSKCEKRYLNYLNWELFVTIEQLENFILDFQ